jgi:hypothetical protein
MCETADRFQWPGITPNVSDAWDLLPEQPLHCSLD